MAILYLVRHGQTEYNANMIVQGHCDSPLTELGKKQVAETADMLSDVNFTICYHSPLGRTCHTADIILKHHSIEKTPRDNLKEINLGTLEGKSFNDEAYKDDFISFWKYPSTYTGEKINGENYDELEERIFNCCKEIAESHQDDEHILIVSHGAAIRSFLNPLVGKSRDEFWTEPDVKPASISIVRWNSEQSPKVLSYAGQDIEQ